MVLLEGTYKGSKKSAELNTLYFSGYWADTDGNKIDEISFGSKVRFYAEKWWAYDVELRIFLKPDNGEEVEIKSDSIQNLITLYFSKQERYFEIQLGKRSEYKGVKDAKNIDLCCGVSNGFGWFNKQDEVAVIKVESSCYCNRDFSIQELKNIIIELRKGDKTGQEQYIRDKNDTSKYKMGAYVLDENGNRVKKELTQYDIIGDEIFRSNNDDKIPENESRISGLTVNLNLYFREYNLNSCIRKLHFIAQAYVETQRFTKTYETAPSNAVSGGALYRGRGMLHLTHDYNYKECYTAIYKSEPTDIQLKAFVPQVANSMKTVCQSSCWYWNKAKCSIYADKDNIANVSAAINRPASIDGETNKINGYSERIKAYELLKKIMCYENCDNKK